MATKKIKDYKIMVPGKAVFIRTVTHHYTGEVIAAEDGFLYLTKCAWIADNGRFNEAMATGNFCEVEPWPPSAIIGIGLGSILDITLWNHKLPDSVKG